MHLTLHLTTACNMRCRYCYAPPRPGPAMSRTTGLAALEFGARMNPGRSCGIIFFGGEPLLRWPLIQEVIRRCQTELARERGDRRIAYHITSNLTVQPPDLTEVLKKHGLLKG